MTIYDDFDQINRQYPCESNHGIKSNSTISLLLFGLCFSFRDQSDLFLFTHWF